MKTIFKCDYCDKEFRSPEEARFHENDIHHAMRGFCLYDDEEDFVSFNENETPKFPEIICVVHTESHQFEHYKRCYDGIYKDKDE